MLPGVRHLSLLGEFKPFGLIAEALDTKPPDDSNEKYDYFLFDSHVAREAGSSDASMSDHGDHEIFIRGNRIMWTTGSRVYKRFTVSSPVIMACWCYLGAMAEAVLCILQADSLTIYSASGEVVAIPLLCSITSIWPLPIGLLLEQASDGGFPPNFMFSSSSLSFGACDPSSLPRREIGQSPQNSANFVGPCGSIHKKDTASLSSHLILKDLMEEPQFVYVEERGRLTLMKDYDERTIWTSERIPLMASYNEAKAQHSLWVAEVISSASDEIISSLPDKTSDAACLKQFSFHRIWQGKVAHAAACKVFLATDDDTTPVVCFLLQGQKKLLSVRLRILEIKSEVLFDVKPDISWSIPAISAAPVMVTRPGVKAGLLPCTDIIVLAPENSLLLYSGKLCLCRYVLPSGLGRSWHQHSMEFAGSVAVSHDVKIVGLADAVEGRVNIVVNSGQMFRCALRRSPSSSLANDCLAAMFEGMSSTLYNHFLMLLWGDDDSGCLAKVDSSVDSEWVSFSSIIMQICGRSGDISKKHPVSLHQSSWDFLVKSQFHQKYRKHSFSTETFSHISQHQGVDCSGSLTEAMPPGDDKFYRELLTNILDSLHAVYESLKLDNLRKLDLELLAVLLCDIAKFLDEGSYIDHYVRDFPFLFKSLGNCNDLLSGRSPPDLFRYLENCLQHGCDSSDINDLPPLVCKDGTSVVSLARKVVSFYSLLFGAQRTGRNLSSGVCCDVAMGSYSTLEEHTILAMVGERFGLHQLDGLPPGVSLPLRHALNKCRESPPTNWPAAAYVLLGREDLALNFLEQPAKCSVLQARANANLIEMSTPYMLHLHPVTIPTFDSDSFGSQNAKLEDADSVDGSMADGMEHIFTSSILLRYGRDSRLSEVRRLLSSARPVAIQTSVNPTASDQDLQQAQLWQLAQRTTALPIGRGAFTLATIYTLLTEVFTVPKLVLAGRLPAQQNATVNLDPNIRSIQELTSWPEFHNAVAAGLRLAPLQGKMSRTWIIYNKPKELNVTHAGLLLALGLHGYLRVLHLSDVYTYLSKEHESTTVGLMLGLGASYRGTMEPSISRALCFHIPGWHASSFSELELPTLLQSAALVSLGLLCEGSAHPQTMQFLVSEIGRRSGGDNVLEREGYAVSAGFSLGLVALGRGLDMLGLPKTLLDRLFHYIGGNDLHKHCFQDRSYLLTPSIEEHNRGIGQMMDMAAFNIDVTAPGAIVALTLMFLKTESELICSRLSIPCTRFDLQYVRPDFIMLRVIARNMIMWTRVHPSKDWIESQVPEIVKNGVADLGDDAGNFNETDVEAFVQAYVNIITGACISLGLRFAGTMDGNAQELLYEYASYFLNEIKPVFATSQNNFPKGLSSYVDRGTLEICLHLIVLSLSVVMAGSGHLQTLKLLKFLRGRNFADGHSNYGSQMMISLATGFLFLGGGIRSFSTSTSSIAALLITLYPRLPAGPNDNRCHVQAFRHLYVLATEARWIQTVDVDTGLPVYAPLEVTVKENEHYSETSFCEITPCILPERAILKSVRVCGPRYWTQVINLVPEEKPWWTHGAKNDPFNTGILYIKRKVGACSYVDDPNGCQSLLSRAMHKVFSLTNLRASATSAAENEVSIVQLVSTFSSDPSLISFAQLCCDASWNCISDVDFQEFCLQVLFECVSKDRPALLQREDKSRRLVTLGVESTYSLSWKVLLQRYFSKLFDLVYLAFFTSLQLLADLVVNNSLVLCDSLSVSSLKLAIAYTQALLGGKLLNSKEGIVQPTFIGSLRKQLEDLLHCSQHLSDDLHTYLKSRRWPYEGCEGERRSIILSWYLRWFNVPSPYAVEIAMKKLDAKAISSCSVPFLRLVFPSTHVNAISEIGRFLCSS